MVAIIILMDTQVPPYVLVYQYGLCVAKGQKDIYMRSQSTISHTVFMLSQVKNKAERRT